MRLSLYSIERRLAHIINGTSILPILKGETLPERGMAWYYGMGTHGVPTVEQGFGFRFGKWKYVVGSKSCTSPDCRAPQLYDLSLDISETTNLNDTYPDVLAAIAANFSIWNASVQLSRSNESFCDDGSVLEAVPF